MVSLVVVAIPLLSFSDFAGNSYHNGQRIMEVLCLIGAAMWLVFLLWRGTLVSVLVDRQTTWLIVLFLALGLVSSITAFSPRHALYEWANLGLLLLLAWIIAEEVARDAMRTLDRVLLLWGLGCALYVFKEIVTYASILQFGEQPHPAELIVGFDNYRFFNHGQTVSLPLLSLLVLRSEQGGPFTKQARYWWVLTSLWWTLLFVSAGRGTFVGVMAGMIMALAWRRRQALSWCRVMLFSGLAGLAAYAVFYVLVPVLMGLQPFGFLTEVAQRSLSNPDGSRWPLWRRASEMIIANPWLGAGPLHFAHYGRDVQTGAHPHNWVLQIASEWGIPALLCVSAALWIGFRKLLCTASAIKANDTQNQALLTVWLATGIAVLVDGLVSGLIVMPISQLWLALYVGCAWGWISTFPHAKATKLWLTGGIRAGLAAAVFLLIFFLGKGLWPEILDLKSYEAANLQQDRYPSARLSPRIWRDGHF
jgi:putative inorganic carbon (hco3(-)) transporter